MGTTTRHWVKVIIFMLLLTAFFAFLISIGDLVKLLIISALFAYVLDPLVTFIESNGPSRTQATVILFVVIGIIIGFGLIFLLPIISGEISEVSKGIDPQKTRAAIVKIESFLNESFGVLGVSDLKLADKLIGVVVEYGNSLFSNLLSVVSVFTNMIIIPFIAFFLLKDGRSIKKQLISLVPNRYFELTCNLLYKVDVQLGNYLRGQIIDALIIGILSISALWLLNVKQAFLIGSFAGMANIVPYIGPLCGAVLAIVFSLVDTGNLMLVLYIAIAFGIIQLSDNIFVQPNVLAKNVNLPPLVILLVVIIGWKFFGILGMILSVPVTAIIKVFFKEGFGIYRQYRFS